MIKLELLVGLSGPEYSLSPGDTRDFPGEVADGKVTGEAGRLIDAGYAKIADEEAVELVEAPTTPARKSRKAT